MDNLLIRKHNFDEAKNKIQRFSNNIPGYVYFDKVDVEGGLFGWGDHKVTGTEMNRFIGKVQDRLVSVNARLHSIIGEFREVYNALDYLDKDYIQGIIASVEASEKATEEALKAQEDIRRTIEGLRQTVNALYNLKEDVDGIKNKLNLLDSLSVSLEKQITYVDYVYKEINKCYNGIDSIWHGVEKNKVDISNLQQRVDSLITKVEVENQQMEEALSSLQEYRSTLESFVHLKDIDSIWHDVEKNKADISNHQQRVDSLITKVEFENQQMEEALSSLQEYRSTLESFVYLKDIDSIWHDVEKNKADISNHQQRVDSLITKVEFENQQMEEALSSLQEYRLTLESLAHLKDIDSIWDDVEKGKVDISNHQQRVDSLITKVEVENQRIGESISSLQEYRLTLESLVHLKDIDSIWDDVEKGKVDLSNLQQQIDSLITKVEVENQRIGESISLLQDYRSTLESLVHLKDIDLIWNNVEKNNVNLSELHQYLNNSILEFHSVINSLKSSLCNIKEQSEICRSEIDKKIKISYIIAGSSIVLVLVQSILILLGIL